MTIFFTIRFYLPWIYGINSIRSFLYGSVRHVRSLSIYIFLIFSLNNTEMIIRRLVVLLYEFSLACYIKLCAQIGKLIKNILSVVQYVNNCMIYLREQKS